MVPVLAALDIGDPSPHFHVTDAELPSCPSTPAGDAPDLKGHSLKTSNKPSLVSTAALKYFFLSFVLAKGNSFLIEDRKIRSLYYILRSVFFEMAFV